MDRRPRGAAGDLGARVPDLVASSLTVVALLVDRLVVFSSWSLNSEPGFQVVVLSLLVSLLHLWTVVRVVKQRRGGLVFSLLMVVLVVYGVALWESPGQVAALVLYTLVLGCHALGPKAMLVAIGPWIVCVAVLAGYPTPWETQLVPALGSELRGLLYVAVLAIYLCVSRLKIHHLYEKQGNEIVSLRSSVEELASANMSYNSFVQMAEAQAARHERSRITRDIHDGVGYALTNLIMLAESTQDVLGVDPGVVRKRLATIRNQAKLALSDTRRALRELRTSEQGLMYGRAALVHMMDVFQQAMGIETRREFLIPQGTLDEERIFPVVYRFVQEALTNSFRHGHARSVEVRFCIADADLVISVSDDGVSPAVIHEGIGLQGMRERLGEVGGELSYHTLQGFTVIARLPIAQEEGSYA